MKSQGYARLMAECLKKHLALGGPITLPAGGELLWKWFSELSAARSYHASGPNPIAWGEIEAYARINRQAIGPHHAAVIILLDRTYLEHCHAGRGESGGKPAAKPISTTAMTAGLFDAMFGGR